MTSYRLIRLSVWCGAPRASGVDRGGQSPRAYGIFNNNLNQYGTCLAVIVGRPLPHSFDFKTLYDTCGRLFFFVVFLRNLAFSTAMRTPARISLVVPLSFLDCILLGVRDQKICRWLDVYHSILVSNYPSRAVNETIASACRANDHLHRSATNRASLLVHT